MTPDLKVKIYPCCACLTKNNLYHYPQFFMSRGSYCSRCTNCNREDRHPRDKDIYNAITRWNQKNNPNDRTWWNIIDVAKKYKDVDYGDYHWLKNIETLIKEYFETYPLPDEEKEDENENTSKD